MFLNKDDDGGSFLALFLKKESNGSRERSKQGLKKVNLTTSRFEQERDWFQEFEFIERFKKKKKVTRILNEKGTQNKENGWIDPTREGIKRKSPMESLIFLIGISPSL